MLRWRILRALLRKEMFRHLANRGALALMLALVAVGLLLGMAERDGPGGSPLMPGLRTCYVDYWQDGPLVRHLRANVPAEFGQRVVFRWVGTVPVNHRGELLYLPGTGAIQVRSSGSDAVLTGLQVSLWHAGDEAALAPYEAWFWKECLACVQREAQKNRTADDSYVTAARLAAERQGLHGGLNPRAGLAAALVLFALFFVCVYLQPAFTCEERERGLLAAQLLSPASASEVLGAKLLFYVPAGLILAISLAAASQARVLLVPFFWLALGVAAVGSAAIGLTIASLARTQRSASLGSLCYLLLVSLVLLICQQSAVPLVQFLALEYYLPRLLHAAFANDGRGLPWLELAGAAALAGVWVTAASQLFRRRGWQ
jgi:hypothetical protein